MIETMIRCSMTYRTRQLFCLARFVLKFQRNCVPTRNNTFSLKIYENRDKEVEKCKLKIRKLINKLSVIFQFSTGRSKAVVLLRFVLLLVLMSVKVLSFLCMNRLIKFG